MFAVLLLSLLPLVLEGQKDNHWPLKIALSSKQLIWHALKVTIILARK